MDTNVGLALRQRAALSPHLEAYVDPATDMRLDYRDLNIYANRCAGVLAQLGMQAGDRIALLMQNSVEFIGLFYGAAKLGMVVVPLNTRLAAAELEFILSDSGTRALFYGPEFAATLKEIRASGEHPLAIEHCISTGSGAGSGQELGALAADVTADEPAVRSGGQDNLFIMYTSGTTGLPKGVVHSHESISWAALSWATTMDVRYRDRLLLPLPMFHVAALTTVITSCLQGMTIVSMPVFDPVAIWTLMREERVNLGGAVPAILNFMRQAPDFETFESPHFRCFVTGAAPMPSALIELYNQRKMQIIQGYALTETGGGGSFLLNEDAARKAGSAGKPAMFAELAVRGEDGAIAARGTGEVVIRAPFLMKEYWNRPDATAEAFDGSWFRTGDVAEIDEEGFIFIKDRIKDMIISGGENIYPAEIENVIIAHPAISEVAVIGIADDKWGEIACAVVVGNRDEVSEDDIIAACEAKLSRYKLPRKVIFTGTIPRNPAGKVLKRLLREQFA